MDFPAALIHIVRYDDATGQVELVVALPLSRAKDCFILAMVKSPLTLVRQGHEEVQLVWPEQGEFEAQREVVCAREGDVLYCERWYEVDDDTRYEVVLRS